MAGRKGMKSKKAAVPSIEMKPADLHQLLDGRLSWMKAMKKQEEAIVADLGGDESVSAAKRSLIKHAVCLDSWIVAVEARFLGGEETPSNDLIRQWHNALNVLNGLYAKIGIKRVEKLLDSLEMYI